MIKKLSNDYKQYVIDLRREFHMCPESSMKEFNTQRRVIEELNQFGISNKKIAGTGVLAWIEGNSNNKTIALRADMDALELNDDKRVDYKSKNSGLMHACGHDGHTASLLGAARILSDIKDQINGTVKFFFQPGEEVALGAKAMIAEGALEGVDSIFGIHLWNGIECGRVSVEAGPRMASAGSFVIDVNGSGGHGAAPHETVDALVVASAIVLDLQSIVSREISPIDPAVISIGKFTAGSRFNVIAGKAELIGTTRCFSKEVKDSFEEKIQRVCENTAKAYRAEAKLSYSELVIPTINDKKCSEIATSSVVKLFGSDAVEYYPQNTGGEDFSFFMRDIPGVLAFVGSKNENKVPLFPHHHPSFDIDEDSLEISSALYAQYVIDYLNSED